jgi:hypothetical protein
MNDKKLNNKENNLNKEEKIEESDNKKINEKKKNDKKSRWSKMYTDPRFFPLKNKVNVTDSRFAKIFDPSFHMLSN